MPWLTPDTLADVRCFRVYLPDNETLRAAFLGAFLDLASVQNWEQFGTQTPDDVANLYDSCLVLTEELAYCMDIGTYVFGAWTTAPDNTLLCDGASYLTADYPGLFGVIGYTFGGSGDSFNVPDYRDRALVGAGSTYSVGDAGGAKTHSLTAAENGPHDHTMQATINGAASGGGSNIGFSATPVFTTASSGSGAPHNNMPPYLAGNVAIVYR